MPAARLSDSQKAELVERFRAGEGLQPLAEAYGCSTNTVSRVVKAALPAEEVERLRTARMKEQRGRRAADPGVQASLPLDPPALSSSSEVVSEPSAAIDPAAPVSEAAPAVSTAASETSGAAAIVATQLSPASASELAIADADDFGDDDDPDDEVDDEGDDPLADEDDEQPDDPEGQDALAFVPLPLLEVVDDHTEIRPRPLQAADLSGCAWMLVDKTVELQARPLSEFPELGRLPPEEQERQALMVFINPRQAKRQCGRTQRVIKIPDSAVLARTAPYLLAQGISRLVIEGALFALPGS